MRWMLEVAFIGLSTSWKWLIGSTAAVAILVGLLFGIGILGGGDSNDTDTDGPFVAAPPTPTPAPKATPRPTHAVAATPVPSATRVPAAAAPAKVISVPILATRAANVGSLEFVLVYDPAKLEFAQVERGLLSGDALIDSSSSEPGRLWAGIIDMQGINGSGPVAVVKFRVRDGVSGAMPLSLESIAAFDANTLVDIVTGTTAGEFNVTELHPLSPIVTFE
jgi:hypothetical protein